MGGSGLENMPVDLNKREAAPFHDAKPGMFLEVPPGAP